jgi:ribosomal protein S18 acetylase RimI-like enzyme
MVRGSVAGDVQKGVLTMRLRHVHPGDYDRVLAIIDSWWGGRVMSPRLSHVFFSHFAPTSFVLETDAELIGFLLGFLSQTHEDEAYVHFVGVHPAYRRLGLGRRLYERFFVAARTMDRNWVRSITSPANQVSIAFHHRLGFEPLRGDIIVDGAPVWLDYAGDGGHRIVFRRALAADARASEAAGQRAVDEVDDGLWASTG